MSDVPETPLNLHDALALCQGLTDAQQRALIIASIDSTLVRLAYEEAPSLDAAIDIAAADINLVVTVAKIKGPQQ